MTPALAHRWAAILTTAGLATLFLTASQSAEMASQHGASAEASIGRTGKHDIGLKGHGFVRDSGGAVTTVDVPGASSYTVTFSIDERGRTVGGYVDARARTHGFIRNRSGDFIKIDFPRAGLTFATRINNHGQIVGEYVDGEGALRGFLLDDGAFTTIDAPAAPPPPGRPEFPQTDVFGINNRGQVTGLVTACEGLRPFLFDNGAFTVIEIPQAADEAIAIAPALALCRCAESCFESSAIRSLHRRFSSRPGDDLP